MVKIPEEKRTKVVKNEDLMKGYIPEGKPSGINWNEDKDALMFKIETIQSKHVMACFQLLVQITFCWVLLVLS